MVDSITTVMWLPLFNVADDLKTLNSQADKPGIK